MILRPAAEKNRLMASRQPQASHEPVARLLLAEVIAGRSWETLIFVFKDAMCSHAKERPVVRSVRQVLHRQFPENKRQSLWR